MQILFLDTHFFRLQTVTTILQYSCRYSPQL